MPRAASSLLRPASASWMEVSQSSLNEGDRLVVEFVPAKSRLLNLRLSSGLKFASLGLAHLAFAKLHLKEQGSLLVAWGTYS